MIRAFVAIALPEAVRFELTLVGHGLPVPRPVPAENLHLTLVFLGELPEPMLADIDAALTGVRAPRFELRFGGLDLFGGAKPSVAYAAIEDSPALRHLQAKVETAARGAGLEAPARRFVPHVTLARLAAREVDQARLERVVALRPAPVAPGFAVEDFRLYRSWLGSSGAVYEELAQYPLG